MPAKVTKKRKQSTPVRPTAMESKRAFKGRYYQDRVQKLFKRKKKKTQDKALLDKMHDEWFFNLDAKYFRQLNKEWNERNLKIEVTPHDGYDEWLNYFKNMPASHIRMLASTGMEFLSTEAYSALARWHDIVQNPHRIDKIYQAGLSKTNSDKDHKTIAQLALENDRLGVLKATRDKIAERLDKGAGSRDTALLTREMTEIMTQIAAYEKRLGPKKATKLGKLLDEAEPKRKRPSENGGGARHTSFKSRVTIKDVSDA